MNESIARMFDLTGRVALVTGGGGSYGREIVRALALAGAETYVASRDIDALAELKLQYAQEGISIRVLRLDQGDEKSILEARDAIKREAGRLDILVNNAVARPAVTGMNEDAARWDESFHVNATGLLVVTRSMAEIMSEGGSIINIGSMMGLVGVEPTNYAGTDMQGWYPDYHFHKGGMVNVTRFFASYYGSRGIRCNCINPGGLEAGQPELFLKNYAERTCLGRLAQKGDLAGSVIFLASSASNYITGTNLPVDGGYTAK
ncbi:SDR family NAD(P)-dependent oxidoreductase [Microbacterium sp.]|uniref:SDR family NAD(P)-dependent oxidoreductase n=1 Tax=Microbacterium sp. TaxID=51671 RepID=UPI003A93FF64